MKALTGVGSRRDLRWEVTNRRDGGFMAQGGMGVVNRRDKVTDVN